MSSSAVQTGIRRLRECLAAQRGPEESDGQLLHAFLTRRDDNAFAALVRRHGPMVLHVCRRVLGRQHDAEDAFQGTFLVLAQSATSLRNRAALASWLHGTAYRTALKARQSAARRRKHEGQTPSRPSDDPAGELLWREVRALLDEEIARLPEAYRNVFILCCLENLSRAEAGQQLGLKERTVSNRLAKARQRLQQRLARRGVELTAVLAASALATQPASALSIVPLLRISRAAVSPAVAALAESASSILTIGKAKLAAVLLLVAGVLTGVGAWACRGLVAGAVATSAETPVAKADDKPTTAPPPRETAQSVEIQGRVLGPDGQPKAGAKLLLLGMEGKTTALGVSAADGQFRIAVPKAPKYRKLFRSLVAQADGTGLDFFALDELKPTQPVELRLVKDHAIRGRLVSTEGKPIAGARVTAEDIEVYPNNSMDVFLDAYLKLLTGGKGYGTLKRIWSLILLR
jgi:RNA polymerase sigma factor (sigma-70 family)